MKIAIVGAGAELFPLTLTRDILAYEALQDVELALFDIDLGRAESSEGYINELIKLHGLPATAWATDDRRKALDGSDVVICVFQVGVMDAWRIDLDIPMEFGVDQAVGDTLGPGGIFRGLRSIAALEPIAADMRDVCPDAVFLQYANPMSINCWASSNMGINTVGLCHSVPHTASMLAGELNVPVGEITYDAAGVNHASWMTTFRRGDEDLIPALREVMVRRHIDEMAAGSESDDRKVYAGGNERVRTELMRLTGYFPTESSHHASEYYPWFRKNETTTLEFIPQRWQVFELFESFRGGAHAKEIIEQSRDGLHPSEEYAAQIIDSLVTGTKRVIYGNVPNNGVITNLPDDACVELACLVDREGVRPVRYGDLPPMCAALDNSLINVHRLVVEAATTGDRDLLVAALAMDPLTGAQLTLDQIRTLSERMITAQAHWLPQFA